MAFMEASAAGLPVVVFECGGALDVVKEGATGWLASPGDWSSLAQAMEKALERAGDPQIRRNVKEMIQHRDVAITAQEYIGVYRSVALDDNTR